MKLTGNITVLVALDLHLSYINSTLARMISK